MSDFANGDAKELEGRARGEAIAAVARTNGGGCAGDHTAADVQDDPVAEPLQDETEETEVDDDSEMSDPPSAKGVARAAEARGGE